MPCKFSNPGPVLALSAPPAHRSKNLRTRSPQGAGREGPAARNEFGRNLKVPSKCELLRYPQEEGEH